MEDDSKKKNLIAMITAVASIVGSMALIGYLSIRFLPVNGTEAYSNTATADSSESTPIKQAAVNWADDTGALIHQPVKIKYILHKDVQKQIGRSLVTYRGKTDSSDIKLDVVVLDLDPEVTYSRTIDMLRAKESFRAGEARLKLISAGGLRLRVWYYP